MGDDGTLVAIVTYKRPAMLARTVSGVLAQAHCLSPPAQVLVVDNDAERSAATVVHTAADPLLRYVHEPRPGIAAARNRSLAEAAGYRVLVFIDDDETPAPGWLTNLVALHERTKAAAVVGAVVPQYDAPASSWVHAGRFFERPRHATGARVSAAGTGNILLDLDQVRAAGLTFDERFSATGGSDTLFTRSLARNGGVLVWCDEAVIQDHVPAQRLRLPWVLTRALRSGVTTARVDLALRPRGWRRYSTLLRIMTGGACRVGVGQARAFWGVLTCDKPHMMRGLRTGLRGTGMLLAATGWKYREYRRK